MADDLSRTDIHLKLVCAKCGNLLTCESDRTKTGLIEAHSAFNIETTMAIIPCPYCAAKALHPMKLLEEAIEELKKMEKNNE